MEPEQCLVGLVLNRPADFELAILEGVTPATFDREDCRAIWHTLTTTPRENGRLDPFTAMQRLSPDLTSIAGQLMADSPITQSVKAYAREVIAASKGRQAQRALSDVIRAIGNRQIFDPLDSIVAHGEAALARLNITEADHVEVTASSLLPVIENTVEDLLTGKIPPKIPTGFSKLDTVLAGGFDRGQYSILAARTGVGKTTVGLWSASTAALAGFKTLYVSVEMTAQKLVEKIIASRGELPLLKFHTTPWSDRDKDAFFRGIEKGVVPAKLWIYDRTHRSIERVVARSRFLSRTTGLDFLVIDYIQQFRTAKGHAKRNEMMLEISAQMQQLAKELNISILCLAQLNRDASRTDRPAVHQIKDCGEFEQDADVILLLHKIVDETGRPTGMYEMSLEKSRHFGSNKIFRLESRQDIGRLIEFEGTADYLQDD